MKRIFAFGLIAVFGTTVHGQSVNIRGKISSSAGQPVAHAVVELMGPGVKDTTGSDGMYSLTKPSVRIQPNSAMLRENMRLDKGVLEFTVDKTSLLKVEIFDLHGNLRKKEAVPKAEPGVYHFGIANGSYSNQVLILHASIGPLTETFRYFPSQKDIIEGNSPGAYANPASGRLAKIAAVADTLKVSADGFGSKKIVLASLDTTVNVTLDADTGGGVPKVTPQNATTIPAMYGNAVTNAGKLETNITYSAYYYSTSFSSPLPAPNVAKQATPKTKFCNVYTPPGYDKGTQYPLIIIMHGITDNPNTWNERSKPKIATLFDNLIASKATKPFIAVFASGTVDDNTNAYYAFGTELMNDLLPFIESKYSVRKDRGSRAMAGFSFGGMQTLSIGLCAHLKEFAWFAGLHAAGPGTPSANDIAKYVAAQNPQAYPLYYLYIGVGASDGTAGATSSNAANGLTSKGPYITSANFSFQNNIPGNHTYPTAEVSLYNFLRMAFAAN
jgi:enterochelin esterase-like enzyme